MIDKKLESEIIHDLKTDAKALGIPIGAAEVFIEKSLSAAKKTIKTKKMVCN